MYAFDYLRPATVAEASLALKSIGGAKVLAGGHTLIPILKLRLNKPAAIVDLSGIAGLNSIGRKGNELLIGAMTTHADVAASPIVASSIPGLSHLAEAIGDPQVRNRGTIGGSLANNDPAADYPAAILALNGTIRTHERTIAADAFFTGLFSTALSETEILTEVAIPLPKRFGYAKFANPASRFALVGVAIAQTGAGVRVAVTGAGAQGVFRASVFEAALTKSFSPDALKGLRVDTSRLISDIHADADYRAHLIGVMAKRAVQSALE